MIKRLSIWLMAMVPVALWAQFAPAEDKPGTTAMHADSSAFVAWATGCTVERGPMRIDKPEKDWLPMVLIRWPWVCLEAPLMS